MKTVAAILVAMVVSATATYFVTNTSSKVEVQQTVEAQTEDKDKAIAALRKALGEATAKANKSEVILVEGAKVSLQGVVTDPADLIDKLANDALTGEDTDSQRRVIHYFESLVDAGNDAVPAIDAFLDQHQDKEFGRQSIRQRLQITSSQIEEMKALEEKLREQFDHTFLVNLDDPLLHDWKGLHAKGALDLRVMKNVGMEATSKLVWGWANAILLERDLGRTCCIRAKASENNFNSASFESFPDWFNLL